MTVNRQAGLSWGLSGAALAVLLGGCAYSGGAMDNPLNRKVYWYSFIGGEDLRASCQAGQPDKIRLVYNGQWRTQQRIVEVTGGAAPALHLRVVGPATLRTISLSDPGAVWRGEVQSRPLRPAEYDSLRSALLSDGLTTPPPVGLRLQSDQFYWTAASCLDGQFRLTAWAYPAPAFQALRFPVLVDLLLPGAPPIAPARPFDSTDLLSKDSRDSERWAVEIGADGLVGVARP